MRRFCFCDSLDLLQDQNHDNCAGLIYHTPTFSLKTDCDSHCKTTQGHHADRPGGPLRRLKRLPS